MVEAKAEFVPHYEGYKEAGVEVLYTLHKDINDQPMYPADGSKNEFHDKIMVDYAESIGSQWPMAADIEYKMKYYYYKNGLPLILLISTDDMVIRFAQVGNDGIAVRDAIDAFLATP